MITSLVYRSGAISESASVDPEWLAPDGGVVAWIDFESPTDEETKLLTDVFRFHELAVEDAIADVHHPKIESYDGMLYLILHGIVPHQAPQQGFETLDVDFFLGTRVLVTVHYHPSRSIAAEKDVLRRHPALFAEGPCSLLHRIIDRMVDHYGPEVDSLEDRLESLEQVVFAGYGHPLRDILRLKSDIASLRRVTLPQRDAISRLARREFAEIPDQLAYRFRDVYDHLVRLTDEALFLQDRVTGLLDAYLSIQSNRLNQVMKVLTVIATIFMPLTVLASLYGMNVELPHLPGGEPAQFWWVLAIMLTMSGGMLWIFRRMKWL